MTLQYDPTSDALLYANCLYGDDEDNLLAECCPVLCTYHITVTHTEDFWVGFYEFYSKCNIYRDQSPFDLIYSGTGYGYPLVGGIWTGCVWQGQVETNPGYLCSCRLNLVWMPDIATPQWKLAQSCGNDPGNPNCWQGKCGENFTFAGHPDPMTDKSDPTGTYRTETYPLYTDKKNDWPAGHDTIPVYVEAEVT